MGVIWTPQTRTNQPSSPVGINQQHPLANNLLISADLANGTVYSPKSVSFIKTDLSSAPSNKGTYGKFNGSSTQVSLGDPACLDFGAGLYSMEALVFFNATSSQDLFSKDDEGSQRQLFFTIGYSAQWRVGFSNNAGGFVLFDSATTISTGKWYHVIVCRTGSNTMTLYVNGVLQPGAYALQTATTVGSSSSTAYIGRRDSGSLFRFSGGMSFLRVYNTDITRYVPSLTQNPWQLYEPDSYVLLSQVSAGGGTVTGVGSSDGVGTASGVGASTSAQVGSSAGVGAASGVGASTANSVGSSSGTGAADGVGSSTGGSDGVGASTGTGTASGIGASTAASTGSSDGVGTGSGVGASTAASTGSASGTGTASGVGTNGSIVSTGVGNASGTGTATGISPTVSRGGGKTTGNNLSRKQKKKLKAVESQEWLKAEETARQLLSDRFTKQTPQEKAQALETYIESLQPVIEALKALTTQIEEVAEVVEDAPVIELTQHQEVIQRFDRLEKKVKSVEELIIILMADL